MKIRIMGALTVALALCGCCAPPEMNETEDTGETEQDAAAVLLCSPVPTMCSTTPPSAAPPCLVQWPAFPVPYTCARGASLDECRPAVTPPTFVDCPGQVLGVLFCCAQ